MVYYAPACTPPIHSLHAAPPLPGRDRSRSRYTREHLCPPVAHLTMAALTPGPDRRLTGFYGAIVGSSSTFSLRASQRYQPRAVRRSWVSSRAFRSMCARNFSLPPIALITAHPSTPESSRASRFKRFLVSSLRACLATGREAMVERAVRQAERPSGVQEA